jgi:hypothetical protein
MSQPEVWLRGPVDGVAPMLQPAAHSFLQVAEDVARLVGDLDEHRIWATPGGTASIGFHCRHLAGSTGRLLTYARGAQLSASQLAAMREERGPARPSETAAALVGIVCEAMDRALAIVRDMATDQLTLPREVGRAKLPSTVIGLIFHAAEHATRHAGQMATLVKVTR